MTQTKQSRLLLITTNPTVTPLFSILRLCFNANSLSLIINDRYREEREGKKEKSGGVANLHVC